MALRFILFDLDGTLLPMDQDQFIHAYFSRLSARLETYDYDPKRLVKTIWKGTAAMVANDGQKTNEAVFWDCFANEYGQRVRLDEPLFDAFYREEFHLVQQVCGFVAAAPLTVQKLKAEGYTVALATNPIFPAIATESRIRWAGLRPWDFQLYTTYENCHFCKPNPDYYREVLKKLGAEAEECLMVGNDVEEDMIAATLGMKVFLLTDCLINKQGKDINQFPHGSFDALWEYIHTLV